VSTNGLFLFPFRRLSSNAPDVKERIEFHLVRDGKKEELRIVKVGGLKDIGALRKAVLESLPKTLQGKIERDLRVFNSEEEAKAGKNAVREGFERKKRGGLIEEQIGVDEVLDPKKTYFIRVPFVNKG